MLTEIWAILVNLFFKILLNLSHLVPLTRLKVGHKKRVIQLKYVLHKIIDRKSGFWKAIGSSFRSPKDFLGKSLGAS